MRLLIATVAAHEVRANPSTLDDTRHMTWLDLLDKLIPLAAALGAVALDRYFIGRSQTAQLAREHRADVLDALGHLVRAGSDVWASVFTGDTERRRRERPILGSITTGLNREEWARTAGSRQIDTEVALARFTAIVGTGPAVEAARTYVDTGRELLKAVVIELGEPGSGGEGLEEEVWRRWKHEREYLYQCVHQYLDSIG